MVLPTPQGKTLGFILLSMALALPAAGWANACSKEFGLATGHWEPYAYYNARKQFTGIDADMTRAIFKEAGCTLVELRSMPAIRNLSLFELGEVDLMMGASRTPARDKLAYFSVAYRDETVGLFALADDAARFGNISSFADYLTGPLSMLAPRAGWYGAQFESQAPALQRDGRLSRFGDFEQGVRMLEAGRASFILGDAAGIEHAAARVGVKVQPLPFWVLHAPVHLMFSRSSVTPADVQRIDAAIGRLKKRGVFEQIRRSYGGM